MAAEPSLMPLSRISVRQKPQPQLHPGQHLSYIWLRGFVLKLLPLITCKLATPRCLGPAWLCNLAVHWVTMPSNSIDSNAPILAKTTRLGLGTLIKLMMFDDFCSWFGLRFLLASGGQVAGVDHIWRTCAATPRSLRCIGHASRRRQVMSHTSSTSPCAKWASFRKKEAARVGISWHDYAAVLNQFSRRHSFENVPRTDLN